VITLSRGAVFGRCFSIGLTRRRKYKFNGSLADRILNILPEVRVATLERYLTPKLMSQFQTNVTGLPWAVLPVINRGEVWE